VDPAVGVEVFLQLKHLAAIRMGASPLVRFRVDLLMAGQGALLDELLITDGALVELLTGVGPHVSAQ